MFAYFLNSGRLLLPAKPPRCVRVEGRVGNGEMQLKEASSTTPEADDIRVRVSGCGGVTPRLRQRTRTTCRQGPLEKDQFARAAGAVASGGSASLLLGKGGSGRRCHAKIRGIRSQVPSV
jgi:hypothetical protein